MKDTKGMARFLLKKTGKSMHFLSFSIVEPPGALLDVDEVILAMKWKCLSRIKCQKSNGMIPR